MNRLTSIVATTREGVIGAANALPWKLRADMAFFKATTQNGVVLMGRKTYDSLGKKCLPGRFNIVISRSFHLFDSGPGCCQAIGISDALLQAHLAPKTFGESFVVGGASIYDQLIPYVDRYLVTRINKSVQDGDTFFETDFLNDDNEWVREVLLNHGEDEHNEAPFSIYSYTARNPQKFAERRRIAIDDLQRMIASSGQKRAARRRPSALPQPAFGF